MSLPSSMADFVPCDRLLQKAYFACENYIVAMATFHIVLKWHPGLKIKE